MPKIQLGDAEVDVEIGPEGAELSVGEGKVKVDAQGRLVGAEAFGSKFQKVESGMLVTREDGYQFLLGDDGSHTMMTVPRSVGITDISKVASYTISADGDGSTHRVTFGDGGYANIGFTSEGKFSNLSGHRLSQTITAENDLIIGQYPEKIETVQ